MPGLEAARADMDTILSERGLAPARAAAKRTHAQAVDEVVNELHEHYRSMEKRARVLPTRPVYALDCEMVEVTLGKIEQDGVVRDVVADSLARCSLVDSEGNTVLDEFVQPPHRIVDYRESVSGITPAMLTNAISLKQLQHRLMKILNGAIVVGHHLSNDFRVLKLCPRRLRCSTRDTAFYLPLRAAAGLDLRPIPSLRVLTKNLLKREIQTNKHCSIQDSLACLHIYTMFRDRWEKGDVHHDADVSPTSALASVSAPTETNALPA